MTIKTLARKYIEWLRNILQLEIELCFLNCVFPQCLLSDISLASQPVHYCGTAACLLRPHNGYNMSSPVSSICILFVNIMNTWTWTYALLHLSVSVCDSRPPQRVNILASCFSNCGTLLLGRLHNWGEGHHPDLGLQRHCGQARLTISRPAKSHYP